MDFYQGGLFAYDRDEGCFIKYMADAIQSAQLHLEDVRVILQHSVIGMTPEGKRVITPTSEAAHDKLMGMGFKSHVESIAYAADRSVPTILQHHVVVVKNVIPGPDSFEC